MLGIGSLHGALKRSSLILVLAGALGLFAPWGNASATITIGQLPPPGAPLLPCSFAAPFDMIPAGVSAGPKYHTPERGVITSWSTLAGPEPSQRIGLSTWWIIGPFESLGGPRDERELTPNVVNTFRVSIPAAGIREFVGLHGPSNLEAPPPSCAFGTGDSGDTLEYGAQGEPRDTIFNREGKLTGYRLNLSLTLLPPPQAYGISPTRGSVTGGTAVKITGLNFAEVKAVSFGGKSPQSVAIESEREMVAISPPGNRLGEVPIEIATVAGTVTVPDRFSYEGCLVPKLKQSSLKAAKLKLSEAGCRIGDVIKRRQTTARSGRVIRQRPKPERLVDSGTKVTVVLAKRNRSAS